MDDVTLCQLIMMIYHNPQDENAKEALALCIDQIPEIKQRLGKGYLPYYDRALPTTEKDVKQNVYPQFVENYRGLNLDQRSCNNPDDSSLIRKAFVNWVLMILKRDCQDVKNTRQGQIIHIPIEQNFNNPERPGIEIPVDINSIETILKNKLLNIYELLRIYIETDPEHILRNCYTTNPEANCQTVIKMRFFQEPPYNDRQIGEHFNLTPDPAQKVQSIKKKKCCYGHLKQKALQLGYNITEE